MRISVNALLIASFGIGYSSAANSEVAGEIPQAKPWIESLEEKELQGIIAPLIVTVVESFSDDDTLGGTPTFQSVNFKRCRQVSFFECISPANANFSVALNGPSAVKGISGVMALTGADSVAYLTPKGFFLSGEGGKSTVEVSLQTKDVGKMDIDELTESLISSLGYDAVVLAAQGDYVLVGSTERRLKRVNLQGLAVADSHQNWSIASAQRTGASLLSLVNYSGPFGVFQNVVTNKSINVLRPGTKVILESK